MYDCYFDQYIQDMIAPDPIQQYLFFNPDFYLQDMVLERTVSGYAAVTPQRSSNPLYNPSNPKYNEASHKKCCQDCQKAHRLSFMPDENRLYECIDECDQTYIESLK